jgi:AmiR/NasT family two-component response regulator
MAVSVGTRLAAIPQASCDTRYDERDPEDFDRMSSLLQAAQLAVSAATCALEKGERVEPHLRAARYFLDLAASRSCQAGTLDAEAATAEVLEMRRAMRTSAVVEQAKGVLMLKLGIDEQQSYQRLVRLSERGHAELEDVAKAVVSHTLSAPAHRRRPAR